MITMPGNLCALIYIYIYIIFILSYDNVDFIFMLIYFSMLCYLYSKPLINTLCCWFETVQFSVRLTLPLTIC